MSLENKKIEWNGSFLEKNSSNIKFEVEVGFTDGKFVLRDAGNGFNQSESTSLNSPKVRNGIPILTRGENTYFHFPAEYVWELVLDGITSSQMKECKVLLKRGKRNFKKQWLKVLYPTLTDENFLFLKINDTVFCSYLYLTSTWLGPPFGRGNTTQKKFSLIREVIIKNLNLSNTIQDTMLLIKRTKTRTLKNYNEVYDICEKYCAEKSLKLVVFDDSKELGNVASQLKKFNSAKVVVGSHGAGFTNLIACKDGIKFIEFCTKINPNCFEIIAKALNIEYYAIDIHGGRGVDLKEFNEMLKV